MMRGGSIVTTLIFSVIFLKSKVMKNQLAGAGLALIGVMVVGLSNMVFKDQSSDGASAVTFIFIFRDFKL
jgi:drug/metabolite transporter (DMT)-like permease